MNKPPVIFRADGSAQTGLGHLVRSGALADMLSDHFDCRLVYRECLKSLIEELQDTFSRVEVMPSGGAGGNEAEVLVRLLADWEETNAIVVLDGYQFDADYQATLVDAGHRVVCIDDIHEYEFPAHLVINHAPSATLNDYQLASYTQTALGLRFALLRHAFRDIASSPTQATARRGIFVCLGGADPNNDTIKVLQRLEDCEVKDPVSVVVGSAYRYADELERFRSGTSLHLEILHGLGPEQMARNMADSAIGITSPSTVSLEYLSAGGQLYLVPIADNQRDIYASMLRLGQAHNFADFSPAAVHQLEPSSEAVMDGLQDYRFCALFRNLGMTCRLATPADSSLYLEWANDSQVRAQSFSSNPISVAEHEKWFGSALTDPSTQLLLFQKDGQSVGQVRLRLNGNVATINYSVAGTARGQSTGLAMLLYAENHLRRHHPDIRSIQGYVKRSNPASLVTFQRLGYREQPTADYPDAVKFEFHEL